MKTEIDVQLPESRRNNFNAIRLCAAFAVLAGHACILNASTPAVMAQHEIQAIGVYIFFILGGYLITKSWKSDPHLLKYWIKRFSRIWPPLAVFVLLATFVFGPLLSSLPLDQYMVYCWSYLSNAVFYITYTLPGVFGYNYYPNAVNGSLWTIPVELAMYFLVPLIITIAYCRFVGRNSRWFIAALAIIVCIADLATLQHPDFIVIIYATNWIQALHILPFYFIGILLSDDRIKPYLNLPLATILFLAFCFIPMPYGVAHALMFLILPYMVLSLAYCDSPRLQRVGIRYEVSYGIFIFGFFLQQVLVEVMIDYGITVPIYVFIAMSLVVTAPCALLCSILVEKPTQKLTKRILSKLNGSGS